MFLFLLTTFHRIGNFEQQFEQSGVAAVIASQQPMNMTGMDHVFPNQQPQYPMQGAAAVPTGKFA